MTVDSHAPTPDVHGAAVDALNATACEVFNFVGMHHEAHDGLYSIYKALEWACFLISIGLFIFYCQQYRKKTAGWEGKWPPAVMPFLKPVASFYTCHVAFGSRDTGCRTRIECGPMHEFLNGRFCDAAVQLSERNGAMFPEVGAKHWLVGGIALGWAKGSSDACPDLGARLAFGTGFSLWALAGRVNAIGLPCGQ
jgi:hypothetical protein